MVTQTSGLVQVPGSEQQTKDHTEDTHHNIGNSQERVPASHERHGRNHERLGSSIRGHIVVFGEEERSKHKNMSVG